MAMINSKHGSTIKHLYLKYGSQSTVISMKSKLSISLEQVAQCKNSSFRMIGIRGSHPRSPLMWVRTLAEIAIP